MIYGASGVGKESVAQELARRNNWHVFPQHLAFDVACAVIGFGNDGFEKHQRKTCLEAFQTLLDNGSDGVVFTFCYVYPGSNYFIDGLFAFLDECGISADFVKLSCGYEAHIKRVTHPNRRNTNKIQSQASLDNYLQRFDFSKELPGVKTFHLDNTRMTIEASASAINHHVQLVA